MSKKLEELVSQHELIIKCKKRAKEIMKQHASTDNPLKLTQCQNLAAQEMKYQHWFELYHVVKNQCENMLNTDQKWWNELMDRFIQYNGSHIHIEISSHLHKENKIKLRLSGELEETYSHLSLEEIKEKTLFVYQHLFKKEDNVLFSKQSHYERTTYVYKNKKYHVGLATILAINGQNIILKITPHELGNKSLTDLGYSKSQYEEIKEICGEINGLLLITGTTGSGMSTTLKSVLNEIGQKDTKIISIEPPLEFTYQNYSKQIQDVLRQQPKLITIEELRDKESIELASKVAKQTNTIATVASSNSEQAYQRLVHLYGDDIDNNLLNGVIHQQLAKVVCPHCAYTMKEMISKNDENDLKLISKLKAKYSLKSLNQIRFRNNEGCSHCVKGIDGQIVCAEIKYMKKNASGTKSKSIKEQAISHMLEGKVDPRHVEELFGEIN